ncbi:MAG: NUDIX domain-containing protein [Synechococcales cyanobacterium RM1_1_8]|nr:NUDIX domain-containing protein [Synechococcales cyanobacterium RM1_1_8]
MDAVKLDFAFGILPLLYLPLADPSDGPHSYLLIRHNQGHWGFPKGHKEGRESDLTAAQREFEEETGISQYRVLPEFSFVERYQFQKKQGQRVQKTVKYFMAIVSMDPTGNLPAVQIQQKEIQAFRWCGRGEAHDLLNFSVTRQVLADCEAAIAAMGMIQP